MGSNVPHNFHAPFTVARNIGSIQTYYNIIIIIIIELRNLTIDKTRIFYNYR